MKKYFLFFCIAWIIFVFHAILTKHAIYGDGNGYYCYTQALFFDHSLNFKPIYNHLEHFQGTKYEFSRIFWNRKSDPYSIGTGLVWIPSMVVMSLFSNNRFDLTHEIGPGLTGIILMLSGLYFIEKYLSKRFDKKVVFWTILTMFFGSNIFYYTSFEPALSHQIGFFIVSLLMYLTDNANAKFNILPIGILAGFLVNVRIGDFVLLLPLFPFLIKNWKKIPIFVLGFTIGIAPQLINQHLQYGGILNNPYTNGENGNFAISLRSAFDTLFSPKRGFITWTPVFALGVYGLFKNKNFLYLATIIIYWLMSSFWSGGLSAGFGLRLMFSSLPYFLVGISYVYSKLSARHIVKSFMFFSVYNALLIFGFYFLGWKNLP